MPFIVYNTVIKGLYLTHIVDRGHLERRHKMQHRIPLTFRFQNEVSELLPGDPENGEAFLEDLANQKLRGLQPAIILIAKVKIDFEPSLNVHILRFCIWCLYSQQTDVQVLKRIAVE